MKKKSFILLLMFSLVLVGCSNKEKPIENVVNDSSENKEDNTNKSEGEEANFPIPETDVEGVAGESGPMKVEVTKIMAGYISPEDLPEEYGDERVQVLGFNLKIENTSNEPFTFEPAFSTITTDNKKQIKSADLLADDISGKYLDNVIQEGYIWFIMEPSIDDVNIVTLHLNKGYNEELDFVGEDLSLEIDLSQYK